MPHSLSLNHTQLSVIANDVIRKMKCGKWEFFDMLRLFLEGLAVCNFLLSIYVDGKFKFFYFRVYVLLWSASVPFFAMICFDIERKKWWDKINFESIKIVVFLSFFNENDLFWNWEVKKNSRTTLCEIIFYLIILQW